MFPPGPLQSLGSTSAGKSKAAGGRGSKVFLVVSGVAILTYILGASKNFQIYSYVHLDMLGPLCLKLSIKDI